MDLKTEIDKTTSPSLIRFLDNPLVSDLEFLTARARAAGTARANKALAPFKLKVRSYATLALACSDDFPTQKEIAEFLSLDASQVVAIIDQLEQAGLVARTPDKNDRRSNVLSATKVGQSVFAEAQKAVAEAEDASLKNLTGEEREQLRYLLSRIAFDQG
jgi:DNA-binding MarR family transcriptional regulator